MHTTKVIKNFTETELKKGIDIDASWHQDVKLNYEKKLTDNSIKIALTFLLEVFILK